MTENDLVLGEKVGCVGQITLNRPRAINALNGEMLQGVHDILASWLHDDDVRTVVLRGAGERGFCAGGDVRSVHEVLATGDVARATEYFHAEYQVDAYAAEFPKPTVALMHGVSMGGGLGLAGPASVRVVTETAQLAMPETKIGFTPDVGGTLLLARAPGRLGEYLGLLGATMNAADALYCGFADFFVPGSSLDDLVAALGEADAEASATVARFAGDAGRSALAAEQPWIDEVFASETVGEIVAALAERPEPRAQEAYAQIQQLSPIGLAVTLDGVREARSYGGLREALAGEYRRAAWMMHNSGDFLEGVRAVLIDRTGDPAWQPAFADVTDWATLGAGARDYTPDRPLFS